MIPRNQRLSKKSAQDSVRRSGRRSESLFFIVQTIPADEIKTSVYIKKEVSRKATERNRIRRAAQAAIMASLGHIAQKHLLVTAKKDASRKTGRELQKDLTQLLKNS